MRKGGDAYDCMKTELRSYSMISCNQLIYRGEANEPRTHTADFPEITSVRNEVFARRQTPALHYSFAACGPKQRFYGPFWANAWTVFSWRNEIWSHGCTTLGHLWDYSFFTRFFGIRLTKAGNPKAETRREEWVSFFRREQDYPCPTVCPGQTSAGTLDGVSTPYPLDWFVSLTA